MTLVVTGVGAITALGGDAESTWARVVRGERGFGELSLFPAEGYRSTIVAEVAALDSKHSSRVPPSADPRQPETRVTSRTSELALRAAREAIANAALDVGASRVGLVVGGTTAGMFETESLLAVLLSPEGTVDPAAREKALVEMLSHPLSAPTDRVARVLGPFARVRTLSSACSSGANAILVGATWLELGLVDAVACGAADALCRVTLAGFNALAAMDPEGARPFDRRRRGLTLGEGAGFVVLERESSARARGKYALCTLLGWAARSEAHHITNPEPSGEAPVRATEAALARAGLGPGDVDYVNAHGTGTPLNDPMEARALARIFGAELARVPVSSQKGQIGHTLAAAGAIEAVITALAIARGTIPPTGGLVEPDPALALTHVTAAIERPIRAAISSSFGFGGMDTVLVFGDRNRRAPASKPAARVVVTGVATLTPSGLAEGADVALVPTRATKSEAVGIDLDAHLDRDRARRLDRSSRLAALACARAFGGAPPRDAGIIVGQAFGAVDPTAAFMRRLREKGPRLVSPAEFPSLVPSSPAGHASIYLGLAGPALVVADLATSGECALAQGFELVAAGEVDRVGVVATEERSAIVEEIFSVLFGRGANGDGARKRREGAAAIAIARADSVTSALAEIAEVFVWSGGARIELPSPPANAVVVLADLGGAAGAIIDASPWASRPRVSCDGVGTHEAAGAIAIAVAAASIARGDASAALVVGVAAKDPSSANEAFFASEASEKGGQLEGARPRAPSNANTAAGYAVVLRSWSP